MNARIFYSSPEILIMSNLDNGGSPCVSLRHQGTPTEIDWELIQRALDWCEMHLTGESGFKSDGLWYHPVKEAIEC